MEDENKSTNSAQPEVAPQINSKYPTELVDLPSEGWFYAKDHPLASGQVEMRYMTARDEDILTSANLIKKGVVLDKLLKSLIVTPCNYMDILTGDKNAIMIAARILGYGKDYEVGMKCPECGEKNDLIIDLSQLPHKEIDFSQYEKHTNEFRFVLPISKREITYQLMTGRKDKALDDELKGIAKFAAKNGPGQELTTRMKHQIIAIDGNRDTKAIRDFVETELMARDSLELRKNIKNSGPDVAMQFRFECEHCAHDEVVDLPIDSGFFWPNTKA
jgi:hypothetical protein|tara:strand:- start:3111 stop:3932 length:822 start_codon:yes stop_codon:yes gene_type:complete